MDADESARATLARLIDERREDFAGLSRLIGRNVAYIQQYVRRGTPKRLAESDRRRLANYFGVEEQLLGAPEPTGRAAASNLVPIPRLQISASAGHGTITDRERTLASIAFDPAWLKQVTSAAPGDLSIIRVQGDSMTPTLTDGDEILVDGSDLRRAPVDGIWVIRHDDSLMVKRLAIHPTNHTLTISSDNLAYPSWSDCTRDSVNLVGRVVWAGRRIA